MPNAKRPRKPFAGNKFLLTSREAKELRAAVGIVSYQVGQLTGLLGQLHNRLVKLEPPPAEPVPENKLDLPFDPDPVPEAPACLPDGENDDE